jgi:hypothetical protein
VISTPGVDFSAIEKIAAAVLYEGFLLYPYRKSSVKNRQRWQFGTLGSAGGSERSSMQTECLIEGGSQTLVDVRIRFLQDEVQRELSISKLPLDGPSHAQRFAFPPLEGEVEVASTLVRTGLYRLACRVLNLSTQAASMCATHTMLGVCDGAFISLMDPPEECRDAAAACRNHGTWPVMGGREGDRNLMLSSPIILYDYPQIAPESNGDFFDGTEMDEMLTLRVLTLSDEEKTEVRAGTNHGREILDRTESLPQEAFAKMHGAIRGLRNASQHTPTSWRKGDRVRLHPARRADIFDIALEGRIAIIDAVERDFEDNVHLAVTVEDDPGKDLGAAAQIGHRFFFHPEEVEPA